MLALAACALGYFVLTRTFEPGNWAGQPMPHDAGIGRDYEEPHRLDLRRCAPPDRGEPRPKENPTQCHLIKERPSPELSATDRVKSIVERMRAAEAELAAELEKTRAEVFAAFEEKWAELHAMSFSSASGSFGSHCGTMCAARALASW